MDENVLSALRGLDVATLTRAEWITVGMALKEGGYPCSVWDDWSRFDGRYHAGECQKKWNSFKGSGDPVTIASVIDLAKQHGWVPNYSSDKVYGWDDEIGYDGDSFQGFSEQKWDQSGELITYLETLFQPDEYVAYVTDDIWNDNGKYVPSKGCYGRTRDEIIAALRKWGDDLSSAIGTSDPAAGAWIRFNPVDGNGVKNENVTRFSYALVESDEMTIDEQDMMYRKLEIPIAVMVHSGGKSLHAIVRVDAKDAEEYRKRVTFLYDYLEQHGVKVDKQNRNPSRLSRMPGIMRNGNRQYLVATNIGRKSWNDWMDYVEGATDELPEIESFADIINNPPVRPPELISGILRQGHKALLVGDSKAGKSFLLMELAISIAEGWPWLNRFQCKKGRILYINLEIDKASAWDRILEIYKAMNIYPSHDALMNLDIWTLRGNATTLDNLVPKILRKTMGKGYICIILDPIYKVIMGDENNASEMGKFCNQFDRICTETKCAVVYCHHHAKGMQGGKKAQDRASGSGVFARDPDAVIDFSELEIVNFLEESKPHPEAKAFRMETSLREFRNIKPINVWFVFPLHIPDESGMLEQAAVAGDPSQFYKMAPKYKPPEMRQNDLEQAYDALKYFEPDVKVTVDALAEYLDISKKTVYRRIKECGDHFEVSSGEVKRKD